jgi:CBS domain-containing protein
MKVIENYIVSESVNIRSAIKQMDKGGIGLIAIASVNGHIIGIVTNGDFRRAILNGIDLERNVLVITNRNYKHLRRGYSSEDAIKYLMGDESVEWLPVIDSGA